VVDLVHEPARDLLQDAEVQDEEGLLVHRALHRDTHPVVVAMQRLALMAPEGDEVGRGEYQVVLADLHAKALCTAVSSAVPTAL